MGNKDNTLGAPTEGLGQRVTFAFDPVGGLPQLELAGRGQAQGGVRGGGTVGAGGTQAPGIAKPTEDPTMAVLMQVGEKIMKPRVEQARMEAFINGMQRAMQGEAVADIAAAQPWYTKIFGDSDVVEGARAYAGQTIAQTQVAAMEDQMGELRKMSPDEARKYFIESVNKNLTGDKPTDMAVLQAMTRALPGVMRRQTKEHYGYQQEQATRSEAEAFRAGVKRLQAGARGLATGFTTPEEFDQITDQFERSLMPAVGRDQKSYKESIKDLMVGAAANGDFHALNAMQPRKGRMGLIEVLDADQRTAVEKAIEAGESKLRTRYSFEWNDDLAKVAAQAVKPNVGQTTADIAAQVDALNTRFRLETGSKSGLIPPSQREAMLSGSAVAISREKDRIADLRMAQAEKRKVEGDKAAAKNEMDAIIRERAADGSLGTLSANKSFSKEAINEVAEPMYRALDPDRRVKFLVENMRESYVIDPIRMEREGKITSVLSAEQYTPAVQQAFDEYAKLRDANRFTADAYYGKHAVALEGFYNDVKNGATIEGAFRDRFVSPGSRSKLGKEDMKAAVEVVSSDYNSFLPEWMGGQKLKAGTARRVVNELSDSIERFHSATGNIKEATARAMHAHKLNGLEIVGGYTWVNSKGQKPLTEYLTSKVGPDGAAPRATDKVNEEFEYAVEELLYGAEGSHGIAPDKASDTFIGRLPDKGGVPMFHVQAVVDGKPYDGVLAASDIYTLAEKRKKREAESTRKLVTLGVPGTLPQEDPRQPSIYAGPEEWKKYREYQASKAKK